VANSVRQAVRSVTSGGNLILNTAFPRSLLPLASVLTALMRFLPTLVVLAIIEAISGAPVNATLVWLLPITALLVVLASGLSLIVAAAQVYFRDLKDFLPFILRLWLYASPVLYYAYEVPERYKPLLAINPLAPLLRSWSAVLDRGHAPPPGSLAFGTAWAVVIFIIGAVFFMSREREFAVRL